MNIKSNGLHSYRKGIQLYKDLDNCTEGQYEYQIKEIILSIHHSIETLSKYILFTIDELLVYADIETFCKNKVKQKLFNQDNINKKYFNENTISFMDALNRLIVKEKLLINEIEYSYFEIFNNYRNAITHYDCKFEDNEVEHLISKLLPVINRLYKSELNDFETYSKTHNIDSNIKEISKESLFFTIKTFLSCIHKINLANMKLDEYRKDKSKIEVVLKGINKGKGKKKYETCTICGKETFLQTGTLLLSDDNSNIGSCKYCGVNFNKDEASLIYYFNNNSKFSMKHFPYIQLSLFDIETETHKRKRFDYINFINAYFKEILMSAEKIDKILVKDDILKVQDLYRLVKKVIDLKAIRYLECYIDDIAERIANEHFSDMDLSDYEDEIVNCDEYDFSEDIDISDEDLTIKEENQLKNYIYNFNVLSNNNGGIFKDLFSNSSDYSFDEEYNFNRDISYDITIDITVNYDIDFDEYYEEYNPTSLS
jgi:hypothetical protein